MKFNLDDAAWRKSSRSGSEGNCVEVATNLTGLVAVRDTKDRAAGTLIFPPHSWAAFLSGVGRGDFDR